MFTGNSSGDWLIKALHEVGLANQPFSISKEDGLMLKGVYITAAVRCVPPKNKPTREEIKNCRHYLIQEIKLLSQLKIILCLGRIAFKSTLLALEEVFHIKIKPKPKFKPVSYTHLTLPTTERV